MLRHGIGVSGVGSAVEREPMAINLSSISRITANLTPRIVLAGVEGIGKSTWAAGSDNPIFIPMKGERGIDNIRPAPMAFPACQTFDELMEALQSLYTEAHDFKTVVLDSGSALEPIIWEKVCQSGGVDSIEKYEKGYGKGYVEAAKYWRQIMEGLDYLRDDKQMGSIIICHVKTKDFNDPETDPYATYMVDLNEKAANALFRWSDAVLFANYKKAIVSEKDAGFNKQVRRAIGTGKRVLYTEKRPAHPGKNRFGLPYELELDYSKFKEAVQKNNT